MIYDTSKWKGEDGALRHEVYISVYYSGLLILYYNLTRFVKQIISLNFGVFYEI